MHCRHVSVAVRAGVAAYAASILLCAMIAVPLLASEDFGHSHADTAPVHAHPITQLLPVDTSPARLQLATGWLVVALLPTIVGLQLTLKAPRGTRRCRAPPQPA